MKIGTIFNDRYKILEILGHGGFSVVYLAKDTNLNKQWAIKEIRKDLPMTEKKRNILIKSSRDEAELMKKLDHTAIPRVVDIIDTPNSICVVMDYIEGGTLHDRLKTMGPQPEELVRDWAIQLCDVLAYLHSKHIIYRDIKPGNVMLKEDGQVKIIDFGIACEKPDLSVPDNAKLGTRGYAAPEQDLRMSEPRSDIYALGMTMHQLLTGADPSKEDYVPAREWNPEISEGMEKIIDRCVQQEKEDRYSDCTELRYYLENPDLLTRDFRRKQKRKLTAFCVSAGLCVLSLALGLGLRVWSNQMYRSNYDNLIAGDSPENYKEAVEIYPERVDAYNKMIEYCRDHGEMEEKELAKIIKDAGVAITSNAAALDINKPEVADMYYDMGKLYFAESAESFKVRAVNAKNFFAEATESEASFPKKDIAGCYNAICKFMTKQSTTSEHGLSDYQALFQEIRDAMDVVAKADDGEANYDKVTLYYVAMLLINDQAEYLADTGFDRGEVLELMKELYYKADGLSSSTLAYVKELRNEISTNYDSFVDNINAKYNEVAKRQQGGN